MTRRIPLCSEICWDLHNDVGGFHRGHRKHPRFELEFACRLGRHQRHDTEGPTLQVNLCHDRVLDHAGHQSRETVSSALRDWCAQIGSCGDLLSVGGKLGPVDRGRPTGTAGMQPAGIDPSAHGVVRDTEQGGSLGNPIMRHEKDRSPAIADFCAAYDDINAKRTVGASSYARDATDFLL